MTVRVLTALYDDRSLAERARDDLIALEVPAGDVALYSAITASPAASTAEDRPFWNELGTMRLPETDRHLYTEAVRRGGHLLVARVPEDKAIRAADALERLDPADLDERVETWRASGWTGHGGVSRLEGVAPTHTEPALAHAPLPPGEDPARGGGFGDSIAYAAEPTGHGTVRRRVRGYRPGV